MQGTVTNMATDRCKHTSESENCCSIDVTLHGSNTCRGMKVVYNLSFSNIICKILNLTSAINFPGKKFSYCKYFVS